jgi:hypothetical protein
MPKTVGRFLAAPKFNEGHWGNTPPKKLRPDVFPTLSPDTVIGCVNKKNPGGKAAS